MRFSKTEPLLASSLLPDGGLRCACPPPGLQAALADRLEGQWAQAQGAWHGSQGRRSQ